MGRATIETQRFWGLRDQAECVAAELARRGWTITELAARAGVALSVISRLLHHRSASQRTLARIGRVLGLPLEPPGPGPDFQVRIGEPRDGGYVYEIHGPAGVVRGWRRGSQVAVEAYARTVAAAADRRRGPKGGIDPLQL